MAVLKSCITQLLEFSHIQQNMQNPEKQGLARPHNFLKPVRSGKPYLVLQMFILSF